ncbi:MAG: DUF3443 family protein [Actinobacteria bacterium]|nr:DUF3443 family protein [Actinomycetota bacterium]MCB9411491.1 DUF3443 family protein [Actinomycetota bacterium]
MPAHTTRPSWWRRATMASATGMLLLGCAVDSATDEQTDTTATSTPRTVQPGAIAIELLDGTVPVVMASVGGGDPVPLLLDTGSAGLRIFTDDVGDQAVVDPATEDETISFVDGTTYVSDKAIAPVTLGSVALPAPVPVALVREVTCEPEASACEPGIDASKASGVHGILGVDMDTGDYTLPSPLLYLPDFRSFTVSYLDEQAGELRPGLPEDDPIAEWDLIPVDSGVPDVDGWAQDFDACWALKGNRPSCLPTSFDTGSTDLVVPPSLPGAPPPSGADEYLTADQGPVELFAAQGDGEPIWRLQPGDDASDSAYVGADGDLGYDGVLAGAPLFYAFDVGFDQEAGRAGLWPTSGGG